MVQSVNYLTLVLGSDLDLIVVSLSPTMGSTLIVESTLKKIKNKKSILP